MKSIKAITQSIIKWALAYYNDNECGGKIEASLRGEQSPPSAAMSLGIMFEYLVTGSTGLKDTAPEPVRLKNGDLSAPYRVVYAQAERVKALMSDMNIEILEVNKWDEKDYAGSRIGGHFDVIANVAGVKSVIDIKYSSTMDDKWSPWGWQWTDKQKEFHSIQAAHYSLITGLPFYYLVAEASEGGMIDFFRVNLSDDAIKKHTERIATASAMLEARDFGLVHRPEYNRCENCPVKEKCGVRASKPEAKIIHV
jgi:hypothetical protein